MAVGKPHENTPTVESDVNLAAPPGEDVLPGQRYGARLRWSLGFVGILGYLVVEYMRLSAQFQFLIPFQVGKVTMGLATLGLLLSPRFREGDQSLIRWMDMVMAFFVVVSFVSACFATYQDEAWTDYVNMLRWAVIYFVAGRIVSSTWRLRVFMLLFMLLNLKMAQSTIRAYYSTWRYGGNVEALVREGVGAGWIGFFANSGDFGVAMCVAWPLAGMLLLEETRRILRFFYLVCFVAFLGGIFVSSSRGAFLAMSVIALMAALRKVRRLGIALVFLLSIPGLLYLLPETGKERLRSAARWQEDTTASIRMHLWKSGIRMFTSHPVLGLGPGNFAPTYDASYRNPNINPRVTAPHSIYIEGLSQVGLLGTIPLGLMCFLFFRMNTRTRKVLVGLDMEKQRGFEYYFTLGLDLAMTGFLVSGAFLTVLYYPHLWFLLALGVGTHIAALRKQAAVKVGAVGSDPSAVMTFGASARPVPSHSGTFG
jgi:O-antigen ligase